MKLLPPLALATALWAGAAPAMAASALCKPYPDSFPETRTSFVNDEHRALAAEVAKAGSGSDAAQARVADKVRARIAAEERKGASGSAELAAVLRVELGRALSYKAKTEKKAVHDKALAYLRTATSRPAAEAFMVLAESAEQPAALAAHRRAFGDVERQIGTWLSIYLFANEDAPRLAIARDFLKAATGMGSERALFEARIRLLKLLPADAPDRPGLARAVAPAALAIAAEPAPAGADEAHCLGSFTDFMTDIVSSFDAAGRAADKAHFIALAVPHLARTFELGMHTQFNFEDISLYVASRLADFEAYRRAMHLIGERGDEGCKGKRYAAVCGLLQIAQVASDMNRHVVSITCLQDAADLAGTLGAPPKLLLQARVQLLDAEWRAGRMARASAALAGLNAAEVDREGHPVDVALFHRLRAEIADAMLDTKVATEAFGTVVDRALAAARKPAPSDEASNRQGLSMSDTADQLVARHVRRHFCVDCGEPYADAAVRWIRRSVGRKDLGSTEAANLYLMGRLMPAAALRRDDPAGFKESFLASLGDTRQELLQLARKRLPKAGEDGLVRALAIAAFIDNGDNDEGGKKVAATFDTILTFLVEPDLEKKRTLWNDKVREMGFSRFNEEGNTGGLHDALDDLARHLAAAGYYQSARVVLDELEDDVSVDDEDEAVAAAALRVAKGRAFFWSSAHARNAALAVTGRDWSEADEELDTASLIAAGRLDEEWTAGADRVALLIRQLRPALRLTAQMRVQIAASPNPPAGAAVKAFEELQRAMLGETGIGLQAAQRRRLLAEPKLMEAVAARDAAAAKLELLAAFDEAVGTLDAGSRREETARLKAEAAAAQAEADRLMPVAESVASLRPMPFAEAQKLLRPGEAILILHTGTDALYGSLATASGDPLTWRSAGLPLGTLEKRVQGLRRALDLREGLPFPTADAHDLFRLLFGPAAQRLPELHTLLVVADGPLLSLPLAVLPTAGAGAVVAGGATERRGFERVANGAGADPAAAGAVAAGGTADQRGFERLPNGAGADPAAAGQDRVAGGTPWLGVSHAVAYLPTVRAIEGRGAARLASQARYAFAGIGNPILGGEGGARGLDLRAAFVNGPLADVSLLRTLPSLPETADEVRRVSQLVNGREDDLFLGERATERAVRAAGLGDYRILMFATHGLMGGEIGSIAEPGLILTPPPAASAEDDGVLTSSEILGLKLDADLVILSACNTAASDGRPRAEGFSGLTRAFLSAGARNLVVTHWSIPSLPAVSVTTHMVQAREADPTLSWSEALRRSFARMARGDDGPAYLHPGNWAAFSVVGPQ